MFFKRSSVEVRPATADELAMLQADLAKDRRWEQVDLKKSVVCVTVIDGEIRMFGSARLIWQIEPIKWIRGAKKKCSPLQQKKATYLTIRWLDGWLADAQNNPFVRAYFCVISDFNAGMKKLAVHFGMRRIYSKTESFGRDL